MASSTRRLRRLLTTACAVLGIAGAASAAEPALPPEAAAGFAGEIDLLVPDTPCTEIEVETGPGGTLRLSGHVGLEVDRETLVEAASAMVGEPVDGRGIDVLGVDFCRMLQVLAPYADEGETLGLEVAGHGSPAELRDGDPLTLELSVPQDLDYLYLAYLQQDGRVGHLGLLPVKDWAGGGRVRVETGFEIAPPFGREMVIAVATARPLFAKARPAFERIESFAPALRYGLARATAEGDPAAVDHVWLFTRP
jgi:hypothetical protein